LQRLPPEVWQPSFATLAGSMLAAGGSPELETIAPHVPEQAQASFWAGVANGSLEGTAGPRAAAAAFSHLPPEFEDRPGLADRITQQWLRTGDEQAASEWVRSLPRDRARDFAAAALAEGIVLTDPEAAQRWAADIQDHRMQEKVLQRIGQ
jgi:hypothetical protein